jgi:RNA polymerase sigma-70 factor (ECF subfamily)
MEVDELTTLVERARQGEPSAYDALVDLYANRLFGFLFRMTGSRADAEDLLQELFVRVVRMLPRYEHRGNLESWLFRIAANLGRDHIRRVRRRPPMMPLLSDSDSEAAGTGPRETARDLDTPSRDLEHQEEADALQRGLAALPEPEREVIMLRHFSDMTFAQIAEIMGTPLGTALARAHRGLARLRKQMEAPDDS